MRIALVHDYIKEYGGAERVLEALHDIFPKAPVFTTVYLPKFLGPHKARFKDWDIRTSWLQYIPFKEKLISPFRIISPYIFKNFDLSGFDVIIVSQTGAYFPNCIRCHPEGVKRLKDLQYDNKKDEILRSLLATQNDKRRKPIHICYTHTPPRYLYGYKTARQWKNNIILRILGEIANHYLRIIDFNASQNVDYFIANSEEVQARIRKFYRRECVVIYPPAVNDKISNFQFPISNKNTKSKISNSKLTGKWELATGKYYLTGGRLARAKGTDIIIDAFIKLNKPLKVFGKGFAGFENELKEKLNNYSSSPSTSLRVNESRSLNKESSLRRLTDRTINNIEFLGEVTEEEKFELMKNAKAFVFASFDEDFGITPVEAMSMGTPVIAYRSGGVKETVIDGKSGIFYDENNPESLIKAVRKFEKMTFDLKMCMKQAEKFSKEKFKKTIRKFVASHA